MPRLPTLLLSCALGACSFAPGLPESSPALRDMEEPLDLFAEPDDEAARQALPAGTFSGLTLADARDTLAAKLDDQPGALVVESVVENSPADAAGLQPGDLILLAIVGADSLDVRRPSDWRRLELEAQPGWKVQLVIDRAGREASVELQLAQRVRPATRRPVERYREEQRAGVVLRTATEVEARAAGLGPGGGAVVVGLSSRSPWRAAGLRFGDLVVAVGGHPVAHPQDLLNAIGDPTYSVLQLGFVRGGERCSATVALTQREQELQEFSIPLLFSYEAARGRSEWSLLFGLLGYEGTAAAWRCQLLWLIGFGGGDADQLLEADA